MDGHLKDNGFNNPYTFNGVPFTGVAKTYYTCDWNGEADGGYLGWHVTDESLSSIYRSECDRFGYDCGRWYVEADFVDGKWQGIRKS